MVSPRGSPSFGEGCAGAEWALKMGFPPIPFTGEGGFQGGGVFRGRFLGRGRVFWRELGDGEEVAPEGLGRRLGSEVAPVMEVGGGGAGRSRGGRLLRGAEALPGGLTAGDLGKLWG